MPFKNRFDAGEKLSEVYKLPKNSILFAIPRGGVPVAYALSKSQKIPMEIVVVRKLPIPFDPEAGFGAITIDGKVILNPNFEYLFSEIPIEEIAKDVLNYKLGKRTFWSYRK
jgi:putative phosphoribosyl transferase